MPDTIEVVQAVSVIEASAPGPQGPAGPPGSSTGGIYVHTQASASSEWVVNHNLGRTVIATVYDSGGAEIEANVVQVTTNQLRVYLTSAITGTAVAA